MYLYSAGLILILKIMITIICAILFSLSLYRNFCIKKRRDRCAKKSVRKKYDAKLKRNTYIIVFMSMFGMSLFAFLFYNMKYMITDTFAWTPEENSADFNAVFQQIERTENEERDKEYQALHMNWMDNINDIKIDVALLKTYDRLVKNIFMVAPLEIDKVDPRVENLDQKWKDELDEKRKEFKMVVEGDIENISSEKLWEGFLAGEKVIEMHYTSENVFQNAVLAEGAHSKSMNEENTTMYAAGAIEHFEKFLSFSEMKAGGNVIIEKGNVAFRKGKILLRESENDQYKDKPEEVHFSLYSWNCFKYALNDITPENLDYLLYLYYTSLSGIEVMKFIDDDELKRKISEKLLDKWEGLEQQDPNYLETYKVEDKDPKQILEVKELLEQMLPGRENSGG